MVTNSEEFEQFLSKTMRLPTSASDSAAEVPHGGDLLSMLVEQCNADSRAWYPEMYGAGYSQTPRLHILIHHALALCGEAGEFANIVKKIDRGSLDFHDMKVRFKLQDELVDQLVYILCLAGILEFDLLKAYHTKREFNINRFGPGGDV